MFKNIARALRLPFITASILPFIFGSLIVRRDFNLAGFLFGLFAVIFTHSSANLINDYFDSRSGVDWKDRNFYGFFGGSKLIQEGVFSDKFYLKAALACAGIAFISVIFLAVNLKSWFVILIYLLIIILSWQYTAKPLTFSYNYLGEFFVFLLFGPALVMGGYFIQTGIFPSLKSLVMSLPFGFFTMAILFANEVPDFFGDKQAGKNNLITFCGIEGAFLVYYTLIALGLLSIFACVFLGYLSIIAIFSAVIIIPAIRARDILKRDYSDKFKLLRSSKLTIDIQMLTGIILILNLLL
ncbi:MAG: prenyltransferase [Candidatus Omnitrophota bacterium]|nr:prenyltransferase [Candidatus Omnitrophota bacterium]